MSKRKSRRSGVSKGLIATLIIVGTLGVAAGVTAIVTKGFKQWGPAEGMIKGGVAVEKFTAKSLSDGTLVLTNGLKDSDEITLTSSFAGSLKLDDDNKPEALFLGSDEGDATTTKTVLESTLASYKPANKDVEKIEDEVLALDVTKMSKMSIGLHVAYEEENKEQDAIEMPYFDAIRFNYKIAESRMIVTGNIGSEKQSCSYVKRSNTITELYENVSIFPVGKEETISENQVDLLSFSLKGGTNNKIEIKSVEFVRTNNKHKGETCWFTQA